MQVSVVKHILLDLTDDGFQLEIGDVYDSSFNIRIKNSNNFSFSDVKNPMNHLKNYMRSEGYKCTFHESFVGKRMSVEFKKNVFLMMKSKSKNGKL